MTRLPLAAFGFGDDAGATRLLAVRALTATCMHGAGYAAFTPQDAVNEGSGARPDNATALPAGPFGYIPESLAATQGFHGARATAVPQPRRALEAAEEKALQECTGSVFSQVQEPDQAGAELVSRLFAESQAALDKDARVAGAVQAWSDCMNKAGFPGASPTGLMDQYRRTAAATPTPTPEELAAARADAACTTSSNLAGIWFETLAGYQNQQIASHQQQLTAYQGTFKEYQAKLAKIVADS